MVFQNLVVIQLINAVTRGDNYIWLMALLEELDILIKCIRCSLVPVAVRCCNGRSEYKQTSLLSSEIPPLALVQMLVQ